MEDTAPKPIIPGFIIALTAILIIGAIVLFGYVFLFSAKPKTSELSRQIVPTPTSAAVPAILNCGVVNIEAGKKPDSKPLTCFINAAANCTPAQVRVVKPDDNFSHTGLTMKTLTSFELKGEKSSYCEVHTKTEAATFTIADTSIGSNETGLKIEKDLIGSAGTCNFARSDLVAVLTNWQSGITSKNELAKGACSGKYFDLVKTYSE